MKKFFIMLITVGAIMLLGTAGASDVGNITVGRACMQGLASVGFLFSGMFGMLLCRMDEVKMRRSRKMRAMRNRASV
ncbi:MAG: hypothetical protein PHE47_00435 [Oscillospiraceae bacterium]|nr:hypothetical protein [Oscillospiraceae bacterium]